MRYAGELARVTRNEFSCIDYKQQRNQAPRRRVLRSLRSPLTRTEDIAAIRSRIAKAELDRARFLAARMPERHLEACSMVEALERS